MASISDKSVQLPLVLLVMPVICSLLMRGRLNRDGDKPAALPASRLLP